MLEETKKEVREIKAIESTLKWNMQREEKKEKLLDEKASVEEMRDWRWKRSEEMKAYNQAKAKEKQVAELKESKSFQEFKREIKVVAKEEAKQQITEEYLKDKEYAQQRAEFVKVLYNREKELVVARVEDYLEHREIRNYQKEQEKMEVDENRAHEQTLEMAAIAKEIAQEKEQLLLSLEHSRSAQRAPHRMGAPPSAVLGQLS